MKNHYQCKVKCFISLDVGCSHSAGLLGTTFAPPHLTFEHLTPSAYAYHTAPGSIGLTSMVYIRFHNRGLSWKETYIAWQKYCTLALGIN